MAQPSNPFASFGAWPWMGQTQPFAPIFKMPWQSDWMGDWARAVQSLQQGDAPNPLPPAMPVLRFAPEKPRVAGRIHEGSHGAVEPQPASAA